MTKKINILLLLTLSINFTGCKILQKKTEYTAKKEVDTKKELSKIAIAHQNVAFSAKTLEAKIDAEYRDPNNQQALNIKLRLEKDKVIWMSGSFLAFPVAKIMITPTRIQYYEKINKTYFDGDFTLIKKVFGIDLSFEQIQNLLLGQTFFNVDENYIEGNVDNVFSLTPMFPNPKYDLVYLFDSLHYKLKSQEARIVNNENLKITYLKYTRVDNQIIPITIQIDHSKNNHKTKIILNIRNVEINNILSFPFEMPSNYEKLIFDDINK